MARFEVTADLARELRGHARTAALAGVVLLAISVVGGFFSPSDFFRSWLAGYLFCLNIALGCLALLMLQYMTGGAWGVVSRRTFEAATRTLPLLALLFIPVIFGMHSLYDWSRADLIAKDVLLQHRRIWMNPTLFIVRAVVYYAIWIGLAWQLGRWSDQQDRGRSVRPLLHRLSAPGLIIYVFTVTFSAVDWAESLTTHWYSTMWGFLFVAMQGLSAIAIAILTLTMLSRREPMSSVLKSAHFHDLGNLLLMFVMIWGYFSFSQLLIVWAGNLVGEITWYIRRMNTSWGWLGGMLIVLQFIVPFLLLLSRPLKQRRKLLCGVAGLIFFMRYIETIWIVMPDYYRSGFHLVWLNLVVPPGIACLWCAAFLWQLTRRPLMPEQALNLEAALNHAGA